VPATHRPLVVTADPDLLDEVLGLTAVAGVEAITAPDLSEARRHWDTAPLVVLDSALAQAVRANRLGRRQDVMAVCRGASSTDAPDGLRGDGIDGVFVLPRDSSELLDRIVACRDEESMPLGRVMGVVAGSGGAGASVFASALAMAGTRSNRRSWLIDLDPSGGGADLLFGLEADQGLRWPDLHHAGGRLSPEALRDALPGVAGVSVLSCDRLDSGDPPPEAVTAVLAATRRTGDFTVVDLPRAASPARTAALAVVDEVLMVVAEEVRAVVAAHRLAMELDAEPASVRAVLRSAASSGLAPDKIFAALPVPVVGRFVSEPAVRQALLQGRPVGLRRRGSLVRLCSDLAEGIADEYWGEVAVH
jgi:secretion/DNA translocation related CpaE-like protein